MISVLEWLDATAMRTPDAVAFADDRDQLTFAQLEDVVKRVASFVAPRVNPQTPVALLGRKSPEIVAALLGVAYARGCYCVLDERQPAARMENIANTLHPAFVFADAEHLEQAHEVFDGLGVDVVLLGDAQATPVNEELLEVRRATRLDIDPLYVNFTSGSTGTPKGVAVSHRSVIDFISHFTNIFGITGDDRIANQAPLDFDVSVKDLYSGISTGAAVHLIPRDYFSIPVQLMDFLGDREVTVCTWAVSAMCFVSIMGGFDYREVPSIRLVVFSGEVMPPKQLSVWQAHLPEAQFVNVYGPTEVTCNCTYYRIERSFAKDEVIPMGKPFPNESVFLLDEDDGLVSTPDTPGEICVSGTALALGYYNDAQRTAEAFVPNPLSRAYPATMYRTGDLARYDEEGNLVYIGRKDHQIKHMGQRIELGEIEACAHAVSGVDRACCTYDSRKKRIMLYYAGECEKEDLVEQLHVKLPSYMTPNKVRQIDEMPLTKNGKIDRVKLASL